ncbi:MAG: methionine--tRNA ligase [Desulfurococcales archaeon ex4484_217_1]|nr:MAG: methionine--tRNA ligase [Desulfurococcales archaeon ex4484_217_1]
MSSRKFYITTPIYYPNNPPHIGTAYTTVIADVIARYKQSLGYDVFFLTGTDEHGMKIFREARKRGFNVKEFVDRQAEIFKKAWSKLLISYNRFIRTTDRDHEETVKEILKKIYEKGDIYKGYYEGFYCVDCERYYTPKDLKDGLCPIHLRPVEKLKMESYFFKLSAYKDKLLKLYEENPEFLPERYRNEVISKVKGELRDISISRPKEYLEWGIPLPFDEKHVAYVWIDALLNYVSGVGYYVNKKEFSKYWPPDMQLIGKDILWFHTVIWPAILMSAGFKLPKRVLAHGFITVGGRKVSKSAGARSLDHYVDKYGADNIRYYLSRKFSPFKDVEFNEEELKSMVNSELANTLGNFVTRAFALYNRYFEVLVSAEKQGLVVDENLKKAVENVLASVDRFVNELKIKELIEEIMKIVFMLNNYFNEKEPWKLAKNKQYKEFVKVMFNSFESLIFIASLLYPVIPKTMSILFKHLGYDKPLRIVELKDYGENVDFRKLERVKPILFAKL